MICQAAAQPNLRLQSSSFEIIFLCVFHCWFLFVCLFVLMQVSSETEYKEFHMIEGFFFR